MKVIVEAGATKSDWRFIDSEQQRRLLLPGMNVSTAGMDHNLSVLSDGLGAAVSFLQEQGVSQNPPSLTLEGFYLYTAGIVTTQVREQIVSFVRSNVGVQDIDVQDDIVAAARAVCGRLPGIVAILGTGSNACSWDGEAVSFRVRSGGYVLGDEGGGAALGKGFLSDYIKGLVPRDVAAAFESRFDSSYEGIVAGVYRSPSPAGYLGSLAPMLLENYSTSPYVKELVEDNFRSFVRRSLLSYDVHEREVGVVGGFGCACKDIFRRICAENGVKTGRFEPEPIGGLVRYHSA